MRSNVDKVIGTKSTALRALRRTPALRRSRWTRLISDISIRALVTTAMPQLKHAGARHLPIICAAGTRPAIARLLLGRPAWWQAAVINCVAHVLPPCEETNLRYADAL